MARILVVEDDTSSSKYVNRFWSTPAMK